MDSLKYAHRTLDQLNLSIEMKTTRELIANILLLKQHLDWACVDRTNVDALQNKFNCLAIASFKKFSAISEQFNQSKLKSSNKLESSDKFIKDRYNEIHYIIGLLKECAEIELQAGGALKGREIYHLRFPEEYITEKMERSL